MNDLIFDKECYLIIGVAMKVHTQLGKGFKEIVYKDALAEAFRMNNIPFSRETRFQVVFEGKVLPHGFNADFFVFDSIVLEIKANPKIFLDGFIQTLNYLKASKVKLGILINFGEHRLKFRRIVCTY